MNPLPVKTAPSAERACRLVKWTPGPFPNPSLLGHCSIAFAGGWVVHQIPVFRSKDGLSVGVSNAAQLDGEGRVVKTRDGKKQYTAVLSFKTADGRERWRRLVLSALAAGGIGDGGEP